MGRLRAATWAVVIAIACTLPGSAGSADQQRQPAYVAEVRGVRDVALDDVQPDSAGPSYVGVMEPESDPPLLGESREDLHDLPPAPAVGSGDSGGEESVGAVQPTDRAARIEADELRSVLAAAGWPPELWEQAAAVSFCESGHYSGAVKLWNPSAVGDSGRSLGLFQIGAARPGWNGWWAYYGLDEGEWADPIGNAALAWRIYQYATDRYGDGWGPWTCKP